MTTEKNTKTNTKTNKNKETWESSNRVYLDLKMVKWRSLRLKKIDCNFNGN